MQEGGKSILAILADGIGAALWRTGPGDGQGGAARGKEIFLEHTISHFTNEMGKCYETDRVGSNGHPVHAS